MPIMLSVILPLSIILMLPITDKPLEVEDATPVPIDGRYLRAYQVAFDDLLQMPTLTARQKMIDGYRVHFTESKRYIFVEFIPKATPAERRTFGGRLLNGIDVKYAIDRRSYSIAGKLLQK